MSGQVCKEILDNNGKILGFEVVEHWVDGVDIMAKKSDKPKKSSKNNKEGDDNG